MAGKNTRWNQALFPIDEQLLEQLIEDYLARQQSLGAESALADDDADGEQECGEIWYLEMVSPDAQSDDSDEVNPGIDPSSDSEAYAVNMRVLDDYLRRRMIDDPDPITPTLH